MAKPVLRFKVNQQAAEVGGRYYGIIEDTPVTPENSILQICEYKKITAFTPEQVLRLVEDVCDGAAKLVARDGQSRQLSTLLKFSPRVRGTFAATDSRWTNQRLIVGARLLKDIKLEMTPSDFVMSNVADIGTIQNAALLAESFDIFDNTEILTEGATIKIAINGTKLQTWDDGNTTAALELLINGEQEWRRVTTFSLGTSDFAANGFIATHVIESSFSDWGALLAADFAVSSVESIDDARVMIFHPSSDIEFKAVTIQR